MTHEGFDVLPRRAMQLFELRAVNKNVWFSFGVFRTEPQEKREPEIFPAACARMRGRAWQTYYVDVEQEAVDGHPAVRVFTARQRGR